MATFILTIVLTCFVTGDFLVIKEKTPNVVRVREGDTLTLEAEVDSHELNLRFTGPGGRPIGYGYDHHRAKDGYEVLGWTDTGYLFSVWLTVEHIDRFQSGSYFLTGFDAYSWERRNWTVVVLVEPQRHVTSVTSSPTCDVNADVGDLSCGLDTAGHVYWEYVGCNVTVRGAGSSILSEFDQCEGLHDTDFNDYAKRVELLYDAAKHGDEQQVAKLLMLVANVNRRYFFRENPRESALCVSARMGHVQVVRLLLNSGASLKYEIEANYWFDFYFITDVLPSKDVTILDCAARSGSVALVQMILERKVETVSEDERDSSFLYAAMSGSLKLVKDYLSRGSDWNHTDTYGRTPIFYAALSGSLELVQFFQSLGADVLKKDSIGNSILFNAARSGSVELVEHLVSAGLQPLEKNSAGETPIVQAVLGGSVPVLEAFLKWGGNVSYIGMNYRSLIHYAAIMGHVAMLEKLVMIGFDINATDTYYATPLHYAVRHNHLSLVRTIISLGGDIEARDYLDRTPLLAAAYYSYPLCVELLLSAGANVSAVKENGKTALHLTFDGLSSTEHAFWFDIARNVEYEQDEAPLYRTRQLRYGVVLTLLLNAGANPNAADTWGRTPLHTYSWVCKKEYIELLVKAGGDLNKADEEGCTPLHLAARMDDLSCARALVEVGASTTAVTKKGQTVLDLAKEHWVSGNSVAYWLQGLKR